MWSMPIFYHNKYSCLSFHVYGCFFAACVASLMPLPAILTFSSSILEHVKDSSCHQNAIQYRADKRMFFFDGKETNQRGHPHHDTSTASHACLRLIRNIIHSHSFLFLDNQSRGLLQWVLGCKIGRFVVTLKISLLGLLLAE